MELYFSQRFGVDQQVLLEYGAFDISVVSDLPLFIDPFLLFNSNKDEYQRLHAEIIRYLFFLRDKAEAKLSPGLLSSWYQFPEVRENWLGFSFLGNRGHALGDQFAGSLYQALATTLNDFGRSQQITRGSHLEKLVLIRRGVGRDNISDFTTNLIKGFLLSYTQTFAKSHLEERHCRTFTVRRTRFNYETESWETGTYYLPELGASFVLLTPSDILTRADTWISHADMVAHFDTLPAAVSNVELRDQINNYFLSRLTLKPSAKETRAAAQATLDRYPVLIDYYIKAKEEDGGQAAVRSAEHVAATQKVLVEQVRRVLADLEDRTDFYTRPHTSYDEALARAQFFKSYIEDQDGYKLINREGYRPSRETDVHLFFGLVWYGSDRDLNREVNNGRGPVDFKVSHGATDKALIEFKLASNPGLKRNLERQLLIYEAANHTRKSVKVIICYTAGDQERAHKILSEVGLEGNESVVLIDARKDNKPSGSKA